MNTSSSDRTTRIDLTREDPFFLGRLSVTPASRQIEWGNERRTIEPRVMQVLVALGRSPGAIVSRGTLIDRCWNGRIVGENAINRVISLIRALAGETAAFNVETITKVGYRLIIESQSVSPEPLQPTLARSRINRRHVLMGVGSGAVLAGLSGAVWWRHNRDAPPERAVRLTQHALARVREMRPDEHEQNVADLQEAVRIAPEYAEAWGGLALVFAQQALITTGPDRRQIGLKARTAAGRALSLDPEEPRASIALLNMLPVFGNWVDFEARCRQLLALTNRHPLVLGSLGTVLQEVGRWRKSVPLFDEVNAMLVNNPIGHYKRVLALWGSGQSKAAEAAILEGLRRFPRHGALLQTRQKMLLFGGRPDEAIAFTNQPGLAERFMSPDKVRLTLATARALASGSAIDRRAASAATLEALPETKDALPAAYRLAALGEIEMAFAILEGYYLGRGRWAGLAPAGGPGVGERWSSSLFQPPLTSLWTTSRFDNLLSESGLKAYWQGTGSRPDYIALAQRSR